jgi:apolipoprotein N-acyltransferase
VLNCEAQDVKLDFKEILLIRFVRQKNLLLDTLCLIAGCCLPLAFAPLNLWFISPIAMAILWFGWMDVSPKRALFRGLLFGLGLYGIGVSWVYVSIHRFGQASIPLALLITFLFIVVLALCIALQGYILSILFQNSKEVHGRSFIKLLLAFPAGWVIVEWLRGWLFTGFPWVYLGYSQTDSLLRGYFPIIGVYGVSFLVAFSASLLVILLRRSWGQTHNLFFCLVSLLFMWSGGWLCDQIQWTRPQGNPISVSIIQGNIPQEEKWLPQNLSSILDQYLKLTETHWQQDLIIWPEAAVPSPLPYSQNFIDHLSKIVEQSNTNLLLGIPVQTANGDFYNAAVLLNDQTGIYYKRHLVPFGEYLPFKRWIGGFMDFLHIPMSDFVEGLVDQKLLQLNHFSVAVYICYEIAYAELVRSDLPEAQLLITLTNDAWFGDSFAPFQHLQIGRVRSLETGRYGICSTNNGVTALIAPDGKLLKTLPQFKTGVLMGQVYAMRGVTPWVRMGTSVIIGIMFLLLFIAWIFQEQNRKR